MSSDALNEELTKKPFKPFRIVMTDGKSYDIRHPDYLWVGFMDAQVTSATMSDPAVWGRPDILDLDHIIRIEPLPWTAPAMTTEANGHA